MKKLLLTIMLFFVSNVFANVNYNVFVKLDETAEKNVSQISDNLKKHGIESLYSKGYVIHLTMYLTEYKEDSLDEIKKIVDDVASRSESFEIEFKGIIKTPSNWLMLDNNKNVNLQALSDELTHLLIPLRAKDAVMPAWVKHYPKKMVSFEKYGSPNVFSNFDPHITLIAMGDGEKLNAFLKDYKFKNFKSKVKGIGIAKVDGLGQAESKNVLHYVEFK